MRVETGVLLPATTAGEVHRESVFRRARRSRITTATFALLTALIATLAPPSAAPALTSRPLTLQTQPQHINVKTRLPIRLAPKITSVTPTTCVKSGSGARPGEEVTLRGSNFGSPKPADYTLAIQPAGGSIKPIAERTWSATGITFTVPAGLASESTFSVGIVTAGAFAAATKLTVCARIQAKDSPVVAPAGEMPFPRFNTRASGSAVAQFIPLASPGDPGGPPEITSVSPADCVKVGKTATANGVNLGTTRQAAGFSLGYQAANEPPTREITESTWSPTAVGFTVPPDAGVGGWFALGIIFDSVFYPQQYVTICGASSGQGGGYYGGGSYGGGDYEGGDYESQDSSGAGPKGARRLGPGGVDIQIAPTAAPEATSQEPPPRSGRPAVGGKLLAMKALVSRGLRKVNTECNLFDPHCPCCRKDDSVCLEKESDDGNGASIWVVYWQQGAKTSDGNGDYSAQSAEDDVEAVTGLRCDAVAGGDTGGPGGAKLSCR